MVRRKSDGGFVPQFRPQVSRACRDVKQASLAVTTTNPLACSGSSFVLLPSRIVASAPDANTNSTPRPDCCKVPDRSRINDGVTVPWFKPDWWSVYLQCWARNTTPCTSSLEGGSACIPSRASILYWMPCNICRKRVGSLEDLWTTQTPRRQRVQTHSVRAG